jgi:hypothetical protein
MLEIQLDIERLHDVVLGKKHFGKTTAMLVEAIQNSDFCEDITRFYIIAHTMDFAHTLCKEMHFIAYGMGYRPVQIKANQITIGKAIYTFLSPVHHCVLETIDQDSTWVDHFLKSRKVKIRGCYV